MSMESGSKCPFTGMTVDFKPFEKSYWDNPYPFWKKVRSEAPVFYHAETDYWVVSRYEDIKSILSNPDAFSAKILRGPVKPLSQRALKVLKEGQYNPFTIAGNDPPHFFGLRAGVWHNWPDVLIQQQLANVGSLLYSTKKACRPAPFGTLSTG